MGIPLRTQKTYPHLLLHSTTTIANMASTIASAGLIPLAQAPVARRSVRISAKKVVSTRAVRATPVVCSMKKTEAVATTSAVSLFAAAPAFAQSQEIMQTTMETNILGLIATALFIIVPTSFLITLFVSSEASDASSGGFKQSYYDKSAKAGKKLTNEAAIMKGKGVGM